MRVVGLSTYDNAGGAARAAYRLQRALRDIGTDAFLVVESKATDDPFVVAPHGRFERASGKLRPYVDYLPVKLYARRSKTPWGTGWFPGMVARRVSALQPDIVHLHWITGGFVSVSDLTRFRRPLVWTLHDSWAFTGGCHIPNGCTGYEAVCGECPQLGSRRAHDLSRWVWTKKRKWWQSVDLTIVAPSKWLADCAKRSSLLKERRIEVIPNGLDTQTYKPVNKTFAREVLNLPQDKKLILYGSAPRINDINKGFSHLCGALQELRGRKVGTQSELVIFGSSGLDVQAAIEMRVNVVGKVLDDATLALLYSAADVTCVPSITEAFGQTASESMACGTPVVAFRTSGLTDVVDHEDNGYLAAPFESSDLARGIEWVLEDEVRWKRLSENARHKAINVFNVGEVARRYASLYEEILRVQE